MIQVIFEVKVILKMMVLKIIKYFNQCIRILKRLAKLIIFHCGNFIVEGLPDEIIKPPSTSDNSVAPALSYIGNKKRVKFDGGCLEQDTIIFIHGKK